MTVDTTGPVEDNDYPTVFREFLYADLERTRSLFAQRLGGVPEEDRVTDSALRNFAVGVQRYLGVGREAKTEYYEQRSLLDALFPALERLLEVEGWLTDISDIVHDDNDNDVDSLRDLVEPGSIVRMTAEGTLFDAEYLARILAGTSVAADGVASLATLATGQPQSGAQQKRQPKGSAPKPSASGEKQLEDLIEEFPDQLMGGVGARHFRAMVRVARGMFPNGLHMLFETDGGVGWTATARLQRGRQYLDAEPDVLFSRYGTAPLDWTIVGTVGYFSESPQLSTNNNYQNPDGTVSRGKLVAGFNSMLALVAHQGFADTPPHPGFSIIPLAVYRTIPRAHGGPNLVG